MTGLHTVPHIVDGEEVDSVSGGVFESINPHTQRRWATVALGNAEDADRAVAAARRAFDSGPWPRMAPEERAATLIRLADLIEENAGDLARLDTLDMGKPITQSLGTDVPRSASNFRFFAEYARQAVDEVLPSGADHHIYTRREPVGVAAAISPWNFPLMQATWKIAPALAFGNTVVLKPAEQSPTSSHRLGLLALEAGIPPGVLNVVHGFGPGGVGEALTTHRAVDLVTFTGESNTGRVIAAAAAPTLKKLSFELGGKGANIVFSDADLDNAIEWSLRAIYLNSGQVCLSGSRLYVQESVFETFLERFVDRADAMRAGDPLDPATEIGPLSSKEHFEKVSEYLQIGRDEGATMVTGGRHAGWTVAPTVFTGVSQEMRIVREEIFGPVVVVQSFRDDAEAISLANDSRYGLSAMIFTRDLARAHKAAAALESGNVWVNCFYVRDLRAPFGGFKDSGVGREGGAYSREFFTEAKAVVMQL
jgi:aminomuconate-semialdehyde/2-hydroxymuconate-6-semialdehyde dehydrogenase